VIDSRRPEGEETALTVSNTFGNTHRMCEYWTYRFIIDHFFLDEKWQTVRAKNHKIKIGCSIWHHPAQNVMQLAWPCRWRLKCQFVTFNLIPKSKIMHNCFAITNFSAVLDDAITVCFTYFSSFLLQVNKCYSDGCCIYVSFMTTINDYCPVYTIRHAVTMWENINQYVDEKLSAISYQQPQQLQDPISTQH